MMHSIRWKILVLSMAVLILPIVLLSPYMTRTFDEFSCKSLERAMIDMAFVVADQYSRQCGPDGTLRDARKDAFADMLAGYGRQAASSIQVLATNGFVVVDSMSNTTAALDLSDQPEVSAALDGRYKARWNLSDDRKFVFYHIALPIKTDGRTLGVVCLARHTDPIIKTIRKMVEYRRKTTCLAVILGILLAVLLAHTITSRLRRLTAASREFAKGSAPFKVNAGGKDEIGELAGAIERMADEVMRTNRYNREFVSAVMHELKMPITAIKGAAELLDQGAFEKKEARDKFLKNIRFEADRLARLVWELNEIAKLDTEGMRMAKEKTAYCACVRGIVERFETTLDEPHAAITLSLPESELPVFINAGRIEQVICNLLDNAARYTPPSGSIEIAVVTGPERAVLTSVRDTGCGIQPANMGKIFDKFFTTEPKDKPKDYGSGLGLAIARSIVENHQGRIRVESAPGKGATFFFTLPLAD